MTTAAAVAAWWAGAAATATQLTTVYVDPENPHAGYSTDAMLPAGVAAIAGLAAGHNSLDLPAQWLADRHRHPGAGRANRRAGLRGQRHWKLMLTSRFICTPAQLAGGYRMSVCPTGTNPRA